MFDRHNGRAAAVNRYWRARRPAGRDQDRTQRELRASRKAPNGTVLIVGGAGYIGSALAGLLLEAGYRVRVLDLLLYGDEPIAPFYSHPNFELVQGDFCHVDTVVAAAKAVDAIVHLGAIVGDAACKLCEELTIEINLQAAQHIAEVGKGLDVKRFIFASTCSVYGASNEILDESSELRPISLYARTKVASERMLLSLADASFAPVILRFGTVYGLSNRPRFDLVVNLLTAKACQDGEASIFGGGQWRPLLHVKDAAAAILLMLQAPQQDVCGQIFNVGSNGQNYQMSDIGQLIQEMVPTAHVVHVSTEDERNYRVHFDKIRERVGFQTRYTVRDGIAEIIDAFATGAITDYQDARFNNFTFLSQHNEVRQALLDDVSARNFRPLAIGLGRAAPAAPAAPAAAAPKAHSVPQADAASALEMAPT